MNGASIGRESVKNYARKVMYEKNATTFSFLKMFDEIIDNAPAAEPTVVYVPVCEFDKEKLQEVVDKAIEEMKVTAEKAESKWIPITYRSLTEEERIAFAEHYGIEYCDTVDEKAFDCPMPEDQQEILISTSWGVVEDVADNDIDGEGFICYGLETNGDWDGVDAWMPKPERYKKGDEV